MTLEMRKLLTKYIKLNFITVIVLFLVSFLLSKMNGMIFFASGMFFSTINLVLLGLIIEYIISEQKLKVGLTLLVKIVFIFLLILLIIKNINYSNNIIFGLILSLILGVVTLLKMQRKDV